MAAGFGWVVIIPTLPVAVDTGSLPAIVTAIIIPATGLLGTADA